MPETRVARALPEAPAQPRGCTNFKLRQLTRRVSRHYDRSLGMAGLKTTQYSLLQTIDTLGPLRPSDLAEAMDMDASTLTRNLQPLVAAGFVAVGEGSDGRTRRVQITGAGHRKRIEARRSWKRAQLAINERLGPARVHALHELIDACLASLGDDPAEGEIREAT